MAQRKTQSMTLADVLTVLRKIAPERLAEPWDKVGLQVGSPSQPVKRALLCIDLTEPVMSEAVKKKADLIIAYHPPIFDPLARLTGATWKQRVIGEAVRRGIAIYSPHTALDCVRGGINDWLCDGLGEATVRFAIGERVVEQERYKVVVFVPHKDAAAVRQAMSDEGAGWIGNYSECSFNLEGYGTFRGEEGTNPTVGQSGRLERVEETRIEMVCERSEVGAVVRAIRRVHPYEEPAIDVYKLAPEFEPEDAEQGAGRVHHLKQEVTPSVLVSRVKRRLGLKRARVAIPEMVRPEFGDAGKVEAIGVCVGAGGSLFEKYPTCDAYITGEMQHHQVLDLVSRGKVVILAGHTNTERPYLPVYRERLVAEIGGTLLGAGVGAVVWELSEADRCPWREA